MPLDSRTLQSTPESGARAGYDGAKRSKGSQVHAAVDTLGHLLALRVTPADEQDRAQVGELASQVQDITGEHVELAYVDQGYTGQAAEEAWHPARGGQAHRDQTRLRAAAQTMGRRAKLRLGSRFRRLARDYERLATTLGTFHFLAFARLMIANLFKLLHQSS